MTRPIVLISLYAGITTEILTGSVCWSAPSLHSSSAMHHLPPTLRHETVGARHGASIFGRAHQQHAVDLTRGGFRILHAQPSRISKKGPHLVGTRDDRKASELDEVPQLA